MTNELAYYLMEVALLCALVIFTIVVITVVIMGQIRTRVSKREVIREEHYGETVWVSRLGEALRKENCLCLQCAKLKPSPNNCLYAQEFYDNCRRGNIALMVTRCREWQPKENK